MTSMLTTFYHLYKFQNLFTGIEFSFAYFHNKNPNANKGHIAFNEKFVVYR
jgi:hypothetical protein